MNTEMPALRHGIGTSLHRQLFLVLRERIELGDFAVGQALPREHDLCTLFGVSRITVRRSLADLEAEGLVRRRHGKGTFVLTRARAPSTRPTLGYLQSLTRAARETEVRVIDVRTARPPDAVAARMQLEPGVPAVHAVCLRHCAETPLLLTDAWVPARLGRRVTPAILRRRALFEVLLEQGVRFGRVVQEITAEAADPWRASQLQTEPNAPLIRVTRLVHDTDLQPVQHLTIHMSPVRSRVLMDIGGDAIETMTTGHADHLPQFLHGRRARCARSA